WKLRGALFSGKRPDGATKEALRAATTEQLRRHSRAGRRQTALSAKTLRAAGLLSVASVGSFLTARCGDARNSPPWPQPKSLAAAPLVVSKQALNEAGRRPTFAPGAWLGGGLADMLAARRGRFPEVTAPRLAGPEMRC